MLASPRLSPRTWSSSSFASQSSRLDLISMDLIQVDDVNDTRRLRSEKENVPPKTSRSQRHVPVKKQRSLRTSPKRVYHHANSTWIAPSPSLLQFSSQPFLHLERDQHLLSCFKHAHLRFPVIHTVRLPSISSITDSQPFWLILYFVFNLALTLYNKLVLVHFPFPYTLTALHALSCTVGGNIMLGTGAYRPAQLTTSQSILLAAFSVLYAVNIAVSNLSLNLVNVAVGV